MKIYMEVPLRETKFCGLDLDKAKSMRVCNVCKKKIWRGQDLIRLNSIVRQGGGLGWGMEFCSVRCATKKVNIMVEGVLQIEGRLKWQNL